LDSIRSINPKHFVTGSQDGTLALWATNKSKPIYEVDEAHGPSNWMTAVVKLVLIFLLMFKGTLYNTDLVASGSYNDLLNFYKFDAENRTLDKIFELPSVSTLYCLGIKCN